MTVYDDNTPMPFGKFQGTALVDVPGSYLLWLYELQKPINNKMLIAYIEDNYDALEKERNTKN